MNKPGSIKRILLIFVMSLFVFLSIQVKEGGAALTDLLTDQELDNLLAPIHGYYFKILTRQGRNVPGGKYNYIVNGNMVGGFALVAFPSNWGKSGVMTFIVNQQGKVYQKNLGPNTMKIAHAMKSYNPDKTWTPVKE